MLFIVAVFSSVYALHVTESIWRGVGKLSVPSVHAGDDIAVGSEAGVVALLSANDGNVKWRRKFESGPVIRLGVTQDGFVAAETRTERLFFAVADGSPAEFNSSKALLHKTASLSQGKDWVIEARAGGELIWRRDEALTALTCAAVINSERLGEMHVSQAESKMEHILVGYSEKANLLLGFSLSRGFTRWRMSLPTGESVTSISIHGGKVKALTESGAILIIDPQTGATSTEHADGLRYTVKFEGQLVGFRGDVKSWSVEIPERFLSLTKLSQPQETIPVTVKGSDASVLFKYLNPNLVGLTSQSEEGIHFRLIDSITGRIVWAGIAAGASGPVYSLVCDNWFLAHFFVPSSNQWEVLVVELFEPRKDLGVFDLIKKSFANARTSSAYDLPTTPWAISKRFIFTAGPVTSLGVSSTAKGVSPRTILFALSSQQVLAINKDGILSARRPSKVREILEGTEDDGLLPYHPEVEFHFPSVVSHSHLLPEISSVLSAPTPLESTSLVVTLGLDIFSVPVRCPSLYDALDPSFDFQMLATSLAVVGLAILVSHALAMRREKAERWK